MEFAWNLVYVINVYPVLLLTVHLDDSTLTCAYISFHDLNNQLPLSIIFISIMNIAKGIGKHIQHSNHGEEMKYWSSDCNSMFFKWYRLFIY
jgi:hypothetical protein